MRTHAIGRTWAFITPLFVELVGSSVVACTLCLVGISEPTRSNHRANSFVDVILSCVSGHATCKLALFLKFVFCTQVCAVQAAKSDLLQPFIVFTPCWNIATCRDALSLMSRLWLWSAGAECTLCRRTHDGRVAQLSSFDFLCGIKRIGVALAAMSLDFRLTVSLCAVWPSCCALEGCIAPATTLSRFTHARSHYRENWGGCHNSGRSVVCTLSFRMPAACWSCRNS